MKYLLYLLFAAATISVKAAPFLVCDPYTVQSDPALNPTQFVIHGLTASDITIPVTQLSNGTLILEYDLSTLPNGKYTVSAAALNTFGGESAFSAPPFVFTRGAPGSPQNLQISPTLLTWVPLPSLPQRRRLSPIRPPSAPSFS